MTGRAFWITTLCWIAATSTVHADDVGVLILAHGGSPQWNRTVEETVRQAQLTHPTEIAFGMAMHPKEAHAIQRAVDALEAQSVHHIIVVPLLISSASDVMRQYQYVLGLRDHGPWEHHVTPLAIHVPVIMASPLDDDPVVADVLGERIRALSHNAHEERIVLIAHGPTSDEDNAQWLAAMARVALRVQEAGGFVAVVPVTMRDDAPTSIRDASTRQLRGIVQQQSAQGRTLVVPLLVANGGIETKIPQRLKGLSYAYNGQALLPHPKVSAWIAQRVEAAAHPPTASHARDEQATHAPAAPVARVN